MISMEMIKQSWSSIVPVKGQNIARRADASHPLDFFIGYNEDENMQLMLISDEEIQIPDSSQQVQVRSNPRSSDGKYAVCFILLNASLKETFISLCWDIMLSTYKAKDKKTGNEAAVRRFGIWLIMLAKGAGGGLSDNSAKGLLGELLVLLKICIPQYGAAKSANGWIGPLHSDRDFEYEDKWYEVKSAASVSEYISISSFDQLDTDNTGQLVVCRLDKTGDADPSGISLNKAVQEIFNLLEEDHNAYTTFSIRLMLSGFKSDDPRADERFLFCGFELFNVEGDFPRIRKTQLSPVIENGEYRLEISAMTPWREM